VLSVDLGHRYAAACAVWETLTNEEVKKACKEAGCEEPSANAMYLHLKSKGQNDRDKTIVYRRIGSDTLNDSPHPGPWARLDRQFLIKLQGEEKPARKASSAEEAVLRLENEIGRVSPEQRSRQVDELMSEAVRTLRLTLRRHGDRARIAYNLIATKKLLPGGREENLTEEGRVEMLTDTLVEWHNLFTAKNLTDDWVKAKWDEYLKPMLNGTELPQAVEDDIATSKERKKHRAEISEKLRPVAERLAQNEPLRMKLHVAWATRWSKPDDESLKKNLNTTQKTDDESLKKNLRWLRDWIMPRGKSANSAAIRNVGGLSLTRIATMKSLYQVQKAFYTRLKPDGSHETAKEGFGQSILDAMENMREQRVKQLASRIVEAALGAGRIKIPQKGKDPKRPCERVDAPCHAVVIENLTYYRPEETRTRRENRQLMTWSSSKVKKYLSEGCQLHGLHLREVQAGYTSRQDSRTSAPGVRCEDVQVKKFFKSPFWKKEIERAGKKQKEKKGDARDEYLLALEKKWSNESESTCSIRIPRKGGEVFVSADENSPASKGIQADINAAANIGLRALFDPDWTGKWWYVLCDSKEFKPVADKVKGSAVFQDITALKSITEKVDKDSESTGKKKGVKKDKSREVVNLWRDPSATEISKSEWKVTPEYWNQEQSRVIRNLRKQAGVDPDDIPF
jgi:hypothetical protein